MTRLLMKRCFDNILTPIKGAYFGLSGVSNQGKITICVSPTPGRCPTSECAKMRLNESHTFKSGHTVTNRGSAGGYPDAYADIDVSYELPIGGTTLPSIDIVSHIPLEVLIPDKNGGYTSQMFSIGVPVEAGLPITPPVVEPPIVELPSVTPAISKTLMIMELPSSVIKGDARTIVGVVDVDGVPVSNEPVIMKIDGDVVDETTTQQNGIFTFVHTFDKSGSHKVVLESPSTDAYPDYGRDIKSVAVSSVPASVEERLIIEREEYAARRKALESKRISVPEYSFEPIFERSGELVDENPPTELPTVEPPTVEPPIVEPPIVNPPLPTRGSIQVNLPVPPTGNLPIEVPIAVWLDGSFIKNAPATINNVKTGAHTVVLKAAGFESPSIDVNVEEGKVSYVNGMEMIPL